MLALLLDYAIGAIPLALLAVFSVAVFVACSLILDPGMERDEESADDR